MTRVAMMIATMGGLGFMRPAPGTWGSAAAVGLMVILHPFLGAYGIVAMTFGIIAVGTWATARYMAHTGGKDPSEVIIDEWAGQWIALWSVAYGASFADVSILKLWPGLVVGFAAFRLFDIVKRGPVRRADQRGDAWGVMLDDLWAGVFALIVVTLTGIAWHKLAL